jgi:hypothetical protein
MGGARSDKSSIRVVDRCWIFRAFENRGRFRIRRPESSSSSMIWRSETKCIMYSVLPFSFIYKTGLMALCFKKNPNQEHTTLQTTQPPARRENGVHSHPHVGTCRCMVAVSHVLTHAAQLDTQHGGIVSRISSSPSNYPKDPYCQWQTSSTSF